MHFERLKQLLIQKAIEGKLVPQLAEEPAVEQIGEAPAEVPFEIPEKWKWGKLSDVTSKISDGTHHSPVSVAHRNEQYPYLYVTAKNIKYDGIDLSSVTYVTEEVHKEIFSRCNPEYGDVLFIKDGATTGIVTVNTLREEFSLLSSVALLKTNNRIDGRYLAYVMRGSAFNEAIKGKMQGTGIPRVTLKLLKNFVIPVPPLSEQRRIVARLNELLSVIKEAETAYKDLQVLGENLRAKMIQKAIEGKLAPQLDEEPAVEQIGEAPEEESFEIPGKWKWMPLSYFVSVIPGTSYKSSDVSSSGIRIIRGGNLDDDFRISFKKDDVFLPESFGNIKQQVRKTDIVIVASTGSLEVIGRPASVSDADDRHCQIGAFLRIVRPHDVSM